MSNILQELEAEIKKATASVSQENVGVIRSVGDGVAKIEGLSGVMLNEMIEFPGGVMGLAMNLEEHEVGAVILGDDSKLKEGDLVKCSGRLLSVPVGRSLLGRVVNTLGEPIDGKGPIEAEAYYPVEKIASGIISRQSVSVPVQTGILPIDAMIPIGRGQRELIIGDRATGKTAIAMDTMIAQAEQNRLAEEGKLPDHQPRADRHHPPATALPDHVLGGSGRAGRRRRLCGGVSHWPLPAATCGARARNS